MGTSSRARDFPHPVEDVVRHQRLKQGATPERAREDALRAARREVEIATRKAARRNPAVNYLFGLSREQYEALVEEVASTVLLAVDGGLDTDKGSLGGFAYTVARNELARDATRRHVSQAMAHCGTIGESLGESLDDHEAGTPLSSVQVLSCDEQGFEGIELRDAIRRAVKQAGLTAREMDVLRLFVEGVIGRSGDRTHSIEAAEILGVSAHEVSSLKRRMREKLRPALVSQGVLG